jgi:hypothetical protein
MFLDISIGGGGILFPAPKDTLPKASNSLALRICFSALRLRASIITKRKKKDQSRPVRRGILRSTYSASFFLSP